MGCGILEPKGSKSEGYAEPPGTALFNGESVPLPADMGLTGAAADAGTLPKR